jgi:hypothetical protein
VYVWSDDFGYGVYSFEPGKPKGAAALEPDDLGAVASFAADLHRVAPSTTGQDLSQAVGASFSLEQRLNVIERRLRGFEAFAGSPEAYDEVRDLCREVDLRMAISELIRRATAGLDQHEQRATLPRPSWRVNTAEFGPQNMLFTKEGRLIVVDFEAAGWDDPARLVMGFVAHAAGEDLAAGKWPCSWLPMLRRARCRTARSPASSASGRCMTWSGSQSTPRR